MKLKLIRHLTLGLAGTALLLGAMHVTASNEGGTHSVLPSRAHASVYDISYDGATARTLYGQPGTISRGDAFILTGKIYPGGTIPAKGATGQVLQNFLGANETVDADGMPGLNFRFTFDLSKPLPKY